MPEPPIDFTVKGIFKSMGRKAQSAYARLPTVSRGGGLQTVEGNLTDLPGFAEGDWWVQDVARGLPARLMGDIKGKRVADLCAAPAARRRSSYWGANVTALDLSEIEAAAVLRR